MSHPRRPSRLELWLVGLPAIPYRLGFPGYERIFGLQWMLITTKGRRTGKPRTVLLDLVGHDPATGRYYVQPGQRTAGWVHNVQAHPFVEAQVGRKCFRARVVDASGPEGARWVFDFAKRHPLQTRLVERLLPELAPPKGSDAEIIDWLAKHVLVFALDPIAEEPPSSP
jgi:deazaflavin-dependent oxidoreductase (nitroreductase family)